MDARRVRGRAAGDPYAVLGVRRGASDDEVHRAYLAQARLHHPDRGGDAAAMQAVNDAWAALQARRRPDPTVEVVDEHDEHDEPHDEHDDEETGAAFDVAYRPGATRTGAGAFVPVGLFAAAVAIGCVGLALDEPALLGVAVLVFFLSCIAIAATTLWSMRR
jgi:hypothetical protein